MSLYGKVALVTGSTSGIGLAIARCLAAEGVDLVLNGFGDATAIEALRAELATTYAIRAIYDGADISQPAQIDAMVARAQAELGSLDILVNNAGITRDGLLMRMSEEDWDAVLTVNLKGTFVCTKAVSRIMMKQRSGSIINIASVVGLMGNAGQANYAASKGGVIAFTKSVAKELSSRNIRANAVAPGFISSKMTDALSDEVRQKMLEAIPLSSFGTPQDVANAVAFLASDQSSYITGQVISVNGGMVM